MFTKFLFGVGKFFVSLLTGGSLEKILDIVDKQVDTGVRQEEIKAEVISTWIKAQTQLLVGRTWWFQLFFVIPAGLYWTALILSQFPFLGWTVYRMPGFAEEVFLGIISALFIVDGGKALLGRFGK